MNPQDDELERENDDEAASPPSIAKQVVSLLKKAGYKSYRHVSLLHELLQLSGHAARRRLNGATPFTEDELRVIAAHVGYDYNGLYGITKRFPEAEEATQQPPTSNRVPVTVEVNGKPVKGFARLQAVGPWMRAANSTFGFQLPDGSYELRTIDKIPDEVQLFAVTSLEIAQPFEYSGTGPFVAILDEQQQTAIALAAALELYGFRTKDVSSLEALEEELAHGCADAFYLSWDTTSKWDPEHIARRIRETKGSCPIILSGPFEQGQAAQTLATIAQKYNASVQQHISSAKLISMTLLRELRMRSNSQETAQAPSDLAEERST